MSAKLVIVACLSYGGLFLLLGVFLLNLGRPTLGPPPERPGVGINMNKEMLERDW